MAEHNVGFLFLERKLNSHSAPTEAPAMGTLAPPANVSYLASELNGGFSSGRSSPAIAGVDQEQPLATDLLPSTRLLRFGLM